MEKEELLAYLKTLKVGDKVCCTYIYSERHIVRNIVDIIPTKQGFSFRLDGGKACSTCGRVATPINGYYDKGIDGKYIKPII